MKLRIKDIRKAKKIKQGDLAEKIGVTKQSLYNWENGDKTPSLERAVQIANALGCTLDDLISDAAEFQQPPKPFDTDTVLLPVYADVSAGMGEAADDRVIYFADASSKYGTGEYYYLKVKGDSMEPVIHDGDLLLVKRTPTVENGKVAVLLIDGMDGVVKKVIYDKHQVTLLSYNEKYAPRVFEGADKQRLYVLGEVIKSSTEVMP